MKNNWTISGNTLQKTFEFGDFNEALLFVNRVGQIAEGLQHHPDITIMYNKVLVSTTTHDAGGIITDKDHALADAIEDLASR